MLEDKLCTGSLQSLPTIQFRRIFVTEEKVVPNRTHDHNRFLAYIANLLSQVFQIDVFDIKLVEVNLSAGRWIIEPLNELNYGRFAWAWRAHNGRCRACLDWKSGILEHWFVLFGGRRVLERDILKLDLLSELDATTTAHILAVTYLGNALNYLEYKGAKCLRSDQALYVWKRGNKTNKARDKCNKSGKHIILIVRLSRFVINMLILNKDWANEEGICVKAKDGEFYYSRSHARNESEVLGDFGCSFGILFEFAKLSLLSAKTGNNFYSSKRFFCDASKLLDYI